VEAGELLSWDLSFDEIGAPVIDLVHTGPPIGKIAEPLLGRTLSDALEDEVSVSDHSIDVSPRSASPGLLNAWIPTLARALGDLQRAPQLRACVTRGHEVIVVNPTPTPTPVAALEPTRRGVSRPEEPEPPSPPPPLVVADPHEAGADNLIAMAGAKVDIVSGERWSIYLTTGTCTNVDAGALSGNAAGPPSGNAAGQEASNKPGVTTSPNTG
jgi:hypothetical protein